MALPAPKKRRLDTQEQSPLSDDSSSPHSSPQPSVHDESSFSDASNGGQPKKINSKSNSKAVRHERLTNGNSMEPFTSGMYKSSMYKLQVDEMLDEVRPDYERRMSAVDNLLRDLKAVIESLPEIEAKSVR